jgi:hypothetical protein
MRLAERIPNPSSDSEKNAKRIQDVWEASQLTCELCGGFGCNIRAKRGLKRFCEMRNDPPDLRFPRGEGTYGSYSEACAAGGSGAYLVNGGGTTGSPRRFAPRIPKSK